MTREWTGRRRVWVAFAAGFVLLAVAIVAVLVWPSPASQTSDSAQREKRDGRVMDYLAGEGRLVVKFRELSQQLLKIDSGSSWEELGQTCERVANALDRKIEPIELHEVAAAIPDRELAEIAVNDRSARSRALVACGSRDREALDSALTRVRAIDKLFNDRLKQR